MATNPVKITDTTFRDAHQSLLATRLRSADLEPIAPEMDTVGFHSMEVWGGATFDAATRFLAEDPWERLRIFKSKLPNTPLMMLLRGQALVGYRTYADDVVDAFVERSAQVGIDIFRVFDALNDERNLERAAQAVTNNGKHLQLTICYSVTESGRLGGSIYNLDYFVDKAKRFQDMGADSICLKDMGGLLAPYDAYDLVVALKSALRVPLQLHTHYTSGMASMTALKAIEAGIDVVDACLAPLALRTSQPAIEPLVVTLRGTERDSGLDSDKLQRMGDYLESMLPKYRDLMESPRAAVIDTRVLSHQIPGGMASNLVSQLREADALERLNEVLEEIPKTRKELGYPPLVTPMSQMIGSQSVSNVLFGRYEMVSGQVKDYFLGLYGRPPSPVDPEIKSIVLKGTDQASRPSTERSPALSEPEMDLAREAIKDISIDIEDVLTYALYPTTGMRFLRIKHGLDPVPDDMKPRTLEQVEKDSAARAEAAKPAQTKPVDIPPKSSRSRAFNVFLGDKFYRVEVDPVRSTGGAAIRVETAPAKAVPVSAVRDEPAEPAQPAEAGETSITAPMPGIILRYVVEVGQKVQAGDPVVVLEAMKMENTLPSSITGEVKALPLEAGTMVAKDQVLAIIVP